VKIQAFGGDWTTRKLEKLRKYLAAYTTIMSRQPFRFAYIDAFAGTGYLAAEKDDSFLFPDLVGNEGPAFRHGSARIALDVDPPFMKYLFIELHPDRCHELDHLRSDRPQKADRIEVIHGECNSLLIDRCRNYNWSQHRAVLFLDPFGMQVRWETVEAIASTKAIDLWYLFPIGIGVNRMLTSGHHPSKAFSDRLDVVLGTDAWRSAFYRSSREVGLFGDEHVVQKDTDFDRIKDFFLDRLRRLFPGVADNPLILRNSRNSPMYLLCFAAANERGAPVAVKIAQQILKE
jgi:three-Cys-motif partner protein